MAEREVRIRFTGESAVLKGSAADVRKIFQNLIDDENDARGAGEKLADAQKQVAAQMKQSMAEISVAADVLADSLGPEMVAAIESTGRSVEDEVARFQKLGLTLDDVKRDSGELAQGMKDLDDAARMGTGAVGDGMRKMATETDNSRSVMANFTGNALQELPGMTSMFGPLNMAIGQFGEQAMEGNIQLKNMAGAAAAMAVVTTAMWGISERAEHIAKVKAFSEDAIKGYAESLSNADTRLEAIADHLREVKTIQIQLGDLDPDFMTGGMTHVVDLKDVFIELGLTVDNVAAIMAGGQPKVDAWAEALKDSGANAKLVDAAAAGMTQQVGFLSKAEEQAAATADFLGTAHGALAAEVDRGADATSTAISATLASALAHDALTAAAEATAQKIADEAAATKAAEDAIRSLADAQRASIDSGFAARDAQGQFITAMEKLATAVDDPKTGVDELRQAQDDAAQAAWSMGLAVQAAAEDLAIAAKAPLSAAESNQVLIDTLYTMVVSLDEKSPVRAALVGYIAQLNSVKPTVATNVTTTGTKLSKGQIDEVADAADRVRESTSTTSTAETKTAQQKLEDMKTAAEEVPDKVAVTLSVNGADASIGDVDRLKSTLDSCYASAQKLERIMNRVAG